MRTCISLQCAALGTSPCGSENLLAFWEELRGPCLFQSAFAKHIKEVCHLMVRLLYGLPEAQAKGPN